MTYIPTWVTNPTHPDAAAAMAEELSAEVARQKLNQMWDQAADPDAFKPSEVAALPRFKAEVAFETMQLTGQIQALSDRSLNEQAKVVVRDSLHLHHPGEYETPEQFFAA